MKSVDPALKSLLAAPDEERRIGPFVLVSPLGRGGYAPVWLAKEVCGRTALRLAAVKIFAGIREGLHLHQGSEDWGFIEEARALCRVEHPNVVRFYSLHFDEERGVWGLAMEYVEGTSLDARLARRGKLAVDETLTIGVAIASALAAVHRVGLVHRDVKPGNIVDAGGTYKLIDFGVAEARPAQDDERISDVHGRISERAPLEVTASTPRETSGEEGLGVGGGTVGYLDPVCLAEGSPATVASDLYSLGATLFECLTGQLPAAAAAPAGRGLSVDVLDGRAAPPSLGAVLADVPEALTRVVDGLLAPDPRARPRSAEWVAIALDQVRAERVGQRRALPDEAVGPFRGLGRFEESDRDVYFGRATETAAALEVLRSRGLLCLVGPSGSGKSSIARAGVLPAVAGAGLGGWPKTWDTLVVSPGSEPSRTLLEALSKIIGDTKGLDAEMAVRALATRADETGRGVLLFVDQLEELVTIAEPSSKQLMVDLLVRLGERPLPGVRVVVAVRRDLLDEIFALENLGSVLARGALFVPLLSHITWGEILDNALSAYGFSFEDETLRRDVLHEIEGTASAMPLVQFALTELWNARDREAKKITRASFRAIGGIVGALDRHADATLAALSAERPGAQALAQRVLLMLTTPQGTRATRRVVEIAEVLGKEAESVLGALERGRLVVREGDSVTLAHEALLVQWNKLAGWLGEAREARLLAEELERDARAWRADAQRAPVWRRLRRLEAEDAMRAGRVSMSPDARAFLAAARRRETLSGIAVTTLALLVLAAFGVVGFLYVRDIKQKNAENNRLVEALAAAPDEASLLALQDEVQELRRRRAPQPPPQVTPSAPVASSPTELGKAPILPAKPVPPTVVPSAPTKVLVPAPSPAEEEDLPWK